MKKKGRGVTARIKEALEDFTARLERGDPIPSTTLRRLPDGSIVRLERVLGQTDRQGIFCPKCGRTGHRRSGIHFDHEYRCGDCDESWDPDEPFAGAGK